MTIIKLSELISASSTIPNIPAGNISATNIQSAINELDSEKQSTLVSGISLKTIN